MIYLDDQSNDWYSIWKINSERKYERNNESNGEITTLLLFKIRTNQDQVPPDEDEELSQFLGLARLED